MSGNSRARSLQTAPIVRARRAAGRSGSGVGPWPCSGRGADGSVGVSTAGALPLQIGQLVLADLELVAVLELVRLDPAPVDVGAVEGAEVVEVEAVPASHQQSVVTRDGHVVQEDPGVRATADRHPVPLDPEALTGPAPARANHQGAALGRHLLDVDWLELPGLAD